MATHPVRCQVTAQPFGSFGEEGDVLGCSLHPGEASFGLLTMALGEPGTGVSTLGSAAQQRGGDSCLSCLFGPREV